MSPAAAATSSDHARLRVASIIALGAAAVAAALTIGFLLDVAPLDLWTYPVAALFSVISIAGAIWARSVGMRMSRAGGAFTGRISLAAMVVSVIVLIMTLGPTVMFLSAQLRG